MSAQNLHPSQSLNQSFNHLSNRVNLPAGGAQKEANFDLENKNDDIISKIYNQVDFNNIFSDIKLRSPTEDHKIWFTVIHKCICLMVHDLSSSASVFKIGDSTYSRETVKALYSQIDEYLLITAATKIIDNYDRIRDLSRYIRATLLSTPAKHGGEAYHVKNEILKLRRKYGGNDEKRTAFDLAGHGIQLSSGTEFYPVPDVLSS